MGPLIPSHDPFIIPHAQAAPSTSSRGDYSATGAGHSRKRVSERSPLVSSPAAKGRPTRAARAQLPLCDFRVVDRTTREPSRRRPNSTTTGHEPRPTRWFGHHR
jgi:hypothetical protein